MAISKPLRGPASAVTSRARRISNPCGDQVYQHRVLVMGSYDPLTGDDPISWCSRNCQHAWRWESGFRGNIWYSMAFWFDDESEAAWFSMVWGW